MKRTAVATAGQPGIRRHRCGEHQAEGPAVCRNAGGDRTYRVSNQDESVAGRRGEQAPRTAASAPAWDDAVAHPPTALNLAGVGVLRLDAGEVIDTVRSALQRTAGQPLAVASVNLDHLHHFGVRGGQRAALDLPDAGVDWLMLIDGSPVARRARRATGERWPRLTGADLLPGLLSAAELAGASVAFLGGFEPAVPALRAALVDGWPALRVAGFWTPARAVVDDAARSRDVAGEIARARADIVVVGLGKPRQEIWIERHGPATGARVLTAFGAAADFLAGSAHRAPAWMRRAGLEWSFRLAQEPRRLSRRYLLEGPGAYRDLQRSPASVSYRTPLGGLTPPPATAPDSRP